MVPEYLKNYRGSHVKLTLIDGRWTIGYVFGYELPEATLDGTWGIILTKKYERSCIITFPTKTITEAQIKSIDIIRDNWGQRVLKRIGDGYWYLKELLEYVWDELEYFIFGQLSVGKIKIEF